MRKTVSEFKEWFCNHPENDEAKSVMKYIDETIEVKKKQIVEFGVTYDLEEIPSSVWYVVKKLIKNK